jgi:L-threonylcarbamoyladenylate synthase
VRILKHNELSAAAEIVKSGGVIVYPTDTVWGVGCDATNARAVGRVIAIKNKPAGADLIWLLPDVKLVKKYFPGVSRTEERLLCKKRTTVIVDGTAVRVVKSGWVNKFVSRCGCPLISTSANLHGEPVVSSWRQSAAVFDGKVDAVIRGGKNYRRVGSTIIKVGGNNEIKILRAGSGIKIK